MKILLVQAYLGGNEPPVFPLGLASLAASIPQHEVQLFDSNTVDEPLNRLQELSTEFDPQVVGISLRNIDSTNKSTIIFYYQWLKDIIAAVKKGCSAKIVLGGSGFSMFAQQIMEEQKEVDFGVYLEGEEVFAQLLDNLETPQKVASVFYRQNEEVHFSGKASSTELENTSIPRWDALPLAPYQQWRDAIGIETKRGCSLSCIYCIYGFLNGRKYRFKKPEQVVNEIEFLVQKQGVHSFTFVDSIFNVPLSHAQAICQEIIARKVTVNWSAWFSERFLEPDFIDLLKQAGCNHIIFSPDGFSNGVLKKLGKKTSTKHIISSLYYLRKHKGLEVGYNFFKNPPGQTLYNFIGILLFCFLAKLLMRKRVHFELSEMRIEPHTELYRIALQEGVITEDQDLLPPTYYTNRRTTLLNSLINIILKAWGK
ncbi:Putative Radical SAM domain protein [Candidatus Electrothrix laxa]